jgi:ATP-dependent helicase/nuclease subunit B
MHYSINTLLNNQTIILTGSRRLAHYLHNQYDQQQRQQGKIIWETPTILPLETWIERCWQQAGTDTRIILNNFQEQLAWERVIIAAMEFKISCSNPGSRRKYASLCRLG